MKDRCYNKNMHAFKHYGGRGISVCQEWLLNYQTFKEWTLKNGYSDNLSIDRIDVNGNYEPSNCRWITQQQQSLNKRDNVYIEYKGEVKTIKEWADKLNVPRHIISNRYHSQVKYSVEEILFTPKGELQGKKV